MGKYLSVDELTSYGIAQATPINTLDNNTLTMCIARAEAHFEQYVGSEFDQKTETLVQPVAPFIDGYGWIWLQARERAPITAVSTVQTRDALRGSTSWVAATWTSDNIILPPVLSVPHPDSWKVRIFPSTQMAARSTSQILVKWTYTGGYAPNSIPQSLKGMIARFAWWIYKLREAPLGRVQMGGTGGIMEMPLAVPADILNDMDLWRPNYS